MKSLTNILNESLFDKDKVVLSVENTNHIISIIDTFSDQLDSDQTKWWNDIKKELYDKKNGNWEKLK